MFRVASGSKIELNNFGAGSVIDAGNDKWAITYQSVAGNVTILLLNLETFAIDFQVNMNVVDPSHMTENEVRMLVDKTVGGKLHWTFTDFDFRPQGIKIKR